MVNIFIFNCSSGRHVAITSIYDGLRGLDVKTGERATHFGLNNLRKDDL